MQMLPVGNRQAWICRFGETCRQAPLVWLMAGEMTQERLTELQALLLPQVRSGSCPAFVLAGFGPVDWDQDYAPWPLETPDGRRFGDGLPQLWHFAETQFLPALQQHGPCYAVGYSLGGLAALYMAGISSAFQGCASCSGSLWYPGFAEWLGEHPPACPVYLSLGGKEKNTRDPLMARVEECTQQVYEDLKTRTKTAFVHEPGGHFRGTSQRLSRAILWLLESHQSKNA